MTRVEAELGALTQCEQADRQRRFAIDADQRFGANQVASGAEQRMAALDRAHLDPVDGVDRAAQDRRFDDLHAPAVSPEPLVANDQAQRDRVDPEDQRPFLGDDVKECIDAVGLNRREHGGMDR